MGGKRKKSHLEKIQARAWIFYKRWRRVGSRCPAFKGEMIYVTRIGWDHLVDPRKHRTAKEKIRRFEALPLAKKLLEISTTFQEHRQDHGISFWAFQANLDGRKIKVIVSVGVLRFSDLRNAVKVRAFHPLVVYTAHCISQEEQYNIWR